MDQADPADRCSHVAPHVCGTGTGHDRGVGVDTEKGTLKFAQAALLPGALLMLFSDKIVGICISFMSTYIDSRYSMYVGMAEKAMSSTLGCAW